MTAPPEPRRHAPATARNREPLLEALRRQLSPEARVLEVASGSGEHAVYFARAEPGWTWLPSDESPEALASIEAHRADADLPNLMPARLLDAARSFRADGVDAVVCINMLHISPWPAAVGLMRGAARCLPTSGKLLLYGPFRFEGRFTAPSNAAFDLSLRARDPAWGIRDVSDLCALGAPLGLSLVEAIEMPANNHVLSFARG